MSGKEAVFNLEGQRFKTPKGTNCNTCGVIYLLQCKTCGKGYVGQTNRTVRERMQGHRRDAKGKNMPLYRHTKNHPLSQFVVTVLQRTVEDDLLKMEEEWIRKLGTRLPKGLNTLYPTYTPEEN